VIIISQIPCVKKYLLPIFLQFTRQSIKFFVQGFLKLKGRNIKKMGIKYKRTKNYQEPIKKSLNNYSLINFWRCFMDIKQLKSRHKELDEIIDLSFKNYVPDLKIRKFKKEKLRIKEQLEKNQF